MPERPEHIPVLLERCVALLSPSLSANKSVLVDATLGLGGHAEVFLQRHPNLHLVGIDRDTNALEKAERRLAAYADRLTLAHAVYDQIPDVLDDAGIGAANGILFDLGVSSMQLDRADRGFAYAQDAPLDMRMDPTSDLTAAQVLNSYSASDLARILRIYGEEKFAKQIARAVVAARDSKPWTNSARLVELLREVIPAPARRTGGHPAKRTFQALRIEVNDELGVLRRAMPAALDATALEGRVAVMSYQSLEDRLVKRAFVASTRDDVPPDMPVVPQERLPEFESLTRGAEVAEDSEIQANPRAASVRLRAVQRVRRQPRGALA